MIFRLPSMMFCAVLALLAAGCAMNPAAKPQVAAPAGDASPGRMHGYVIVRQHSDFTLHSGKERRYLVEYGWDYDHAVAIRKTFDEQGALLETRKVHGAEFGLSESERARASELMRNDPMLKPIVDRPGVVIWAGGFVYQKSGDASCPANSRCVHVIAAADSGNTAVAHAIADLQTDRIVHPFYEPADSVAKTHGE